jgi:hypothetical protein
MCFECQKKKKRIAARKARGEFQLRAMLASGTKLPEILS